MRRSGTSPTLRQKVRYRIWSLPRTPGELDAVLLFVGTLRRIGWMLSAQRRLPIDREARPLPWWTYPAIFWLDSALTGTERVVEFGAGHSTLWLARRVRDVTSIEHDERWSRAIARRAPANVTVLHRRSAGDLVDAPDGDAYVSVLDELADRSVDLLVIDGMARRRCLLAAPRLLRPGGIALLDNSDRPQLAPAIERLQREGFGRLDFVGPVPGGTNMSCTSILFRSLGKRWTTPRRPPRWWGAEIPDFGVV